MPSAKESAWRHPDFVAPLTTFFTVPAGYDLATQGNATIAPGSIEVYDVAAIPGWRQSLLVTGMRTGIVYRVRLSDDGRSVAGAAARVLPQTPRAIAIPRSLPTAGASTSSPTTSGSVLDAEWRRTEVLAHPGDAARVHLRA